MRLCDSDHLLAAGVEPDRIARGAKQSDAGEIQDRHAVTDENGAIRGLEAFVVGLSGGRVQLNDAVRAALPERVRQEAVIRRLLGHKVSVLATALVEDATWDDPLALEADKVVDETERGVMRQRGDVIDARIRLLVVDLPANPIAHALDGLDQHVAWP